MLYKLSLILFLLPGTLKWKYQTGDVILSTPVIGSDGTIYIGSNDYKLYAINADGMPANPFSDASMICMMRAYVIVCRLRDIKVELHNWK